MKISLLPQQNFPKTDCKSSFGYRGKAVISSRGIGNPVFPQRKTIFYGYGGNLTNGHMHFDKTIRELFNPENVSIYTLDKNAAKQSGFKSLNESQSLDPELLDGKNAYIIAPSYTHKSYIDKLSQIETLNGIYVDKPMCINPQELTEMKPFDNAGIYAGDHYYFGNIAALRLMGVDMPFKNAVKVGFDKSVDGKFTKCIDEAKPYFKEDDISSIKTVMQEFDEGEELRGRKWYTNEKGGGILIDLQLHCHNLLNLMGLKFNTVTEARGLKIPISSNDIKKADKTLAVKNLRHFDTFDKNSVEEAVFAKGFINGKIPFELDTIRGINSNTRMMEIKGKNGETLNIYGTSGKKRVDLLNEQGEVISSAVTQGDPYFLMLQDVENKVSNKSNPKNINFMRTLWNSQLESIQQIFNVKKVLGNLLD